MLKKDIKRILYNIQNDTKSKNIKALLDSDLAEIYIEIEKELATGTIIYPEGWASSICTD